MYLTSRTKSVFITAKDDVRSGGNNAEENQNFYDLTSPPALERKLKFTKPAPRHGHFGNPAGVGGVNKRFYFACRTFVVRFR